MPNAIALRRIRSSVRVVAGDADPAWSRETVSSVHRREPNYYAGARSAFTGVDRMVPIPIATGSSSR